MVLRRQVMVHRRQEAAATGHHQEGHPLATVRRRQAMDHLHTKGRPRWVTDRRHQVTAHRQAMDLHRLGMAHHLQAMDRLLAMDIHLQATAIRRHQVLDASWDE